MSSEWLAVAKVAAGMNGLASDCAVAAGGVEGSYGGRRSSAISIGKRVEGSG